MKNNGKPWRKLFVDMSRDVQKAYASAVNMEAELVMTESQNQVPVDTGNLKNSRFIEAQVEHDGVHVELGYRAEYAMVVHELPPERVSHVNGKWKFLEDPLKAAIPGFASRVMKRVKKALGDK